ncbi:unnamed protein product [Meloidogyne enterolobii]|uniref:Uncharacterized protein n=1 Tax=Meloidogyne enterolobii TaxID=390850 RepID=A0ACB0Y1B7_MELEN
MACFVFSNYRKSSNARVLLFFNPVLLLETACFCFSTLSTLINLQWTKAEIQNRKRVKKCETPVPRHAHPERSRYNPIFTKFLRNNALLTKCSLTQSLLTKGTTTLNYRDKMQTKCQPIIFQFA